MPKVVVFDENGARVFKNPDNFEALAAQHNVLVDPDMSHVINVPLHQWRMSGGKIVVAGEDEVPQIFSKKRVIFYKLKPYLLVILGIALGLLIGKL